MGMFSDFVDDLNSAEANKGLLDYFLHQAVDDVPENFGSYKKFSDDSYILAPNNDVQFSLSFDEIPRELKNKGISNSEMLGKYLFSTQQSMSFDAMKFSSDGYEIDPTKVLLEPFNEDPFPIKVISKFFIIPRKFPKAHPVEFSFGEEKEIFYLERQPSEDLNKVWLKSVDDKPLTLSFLFDEGSGKMNISIDFSIRKSKTIDDALKYSIYTDSFFQRDFFISGEKVSDGKFSEEIISQTPFLTLVKEVEQYLQQNLARDFMFDPSLELSHDEYITAHKLYYSLILNKSFKSHNTIDSFTIPKESFDSDFFEELAKKSMGKDGVCAFNGTRSEILHLLGKEIEVNVIEGFSMISMMKYTEVEDEVVISIKQHPDYFSSNFYYLKNLKKNNQKDQDCFDISLKPEEIVFR
ncbi:abortive infection system toxin AbiGii family protein [Enterococcus raffinosus]|uniref:abortive infection system toxin AbiGii family protein n=1 Tax=Enterococcus raffinosus TaxID=71452 RepID=UPI0028908C73|nr:abortive infection system toxin AbiGii family protein [Enterococcus raffinosus]MDT2555502.1 abortive infection system toxin AbiGii family protein [Enterococcus raffinosus]